MRKSLLFVATVLCFACSATSFSHADPLVNAFLEGVNKGKKGGQGDLGGQGGQNDPAQMFQQILQQLTQQSAATGQGSNRVSFRPELTPKLQLHIQDQKSEAPR
jgi:hypothetical protein